MDSANFDAAAAASSVHTPEVQHALDESLDVILSCVETKTGGQDCSGSIRIGVPVKGRGAARGDGPSQRGGRGRGVAFTGTRSNFVPSRFEHHSQSNDTTSVRSDNGGFTMIRDGFCPGEFIIGGVKYTQFCMIAPELCSNIIRIRFGSTRDIVVNSQDKTMLVFFNEQGDSHVRRVDVVHGKNGTSRPHHRSSSGAPRARGGSVRGRPAAVASPEEAKPVVQRRTGSVIRNASAFDD